MERNEMIRKLSVSCSIERREYSPYLLISTYLLNKIMFLYILIFYEHGKMSTLSSFSREIIFSEIFKNVKTNFSN